ncbi:PKD domain-containing protein [Microbacterium koreense]|uniref:PKD domain-containing protein n=1 Tax=Microbacterium koreense TaxID=323761 RepID=A0ABW2ZP37_9MICO
MSFTKVWRGALATITVSGLVLGGLALTAGAASAEVPETKPPLLQRDDTVVTGDPLPTVQINNGYVWAQETIGTTVYAVGQFQNARAALASPGTQLTPRTNILAFDINTGALLPFAPSVNGTIKAVAASPDGTRIYIGGSFNNVNGQPRWNIAALDAQTGQLVPGFSPAIGGSGVYAIEADATSVYAGGLFTQANGTPRNNVAAFSATNGALDMGWTAQPDLQVDAMVMDPAGQNVILGGRFSNVGGDSTWRGMVAVDKVTGGIDSAWTGTQEVKNGWSTGRAGIFALNADDEAVYGTGWVYANATVGNLEGVFALESDSGDVRWIADCLGDHYGVYSTGEVVYSTTHTHACSTMNLWPEQSPRTHRFVHAMTAEATGTLSRQPHTGSTYANWEGSPAPSAYAWYPDFAVGTTSGLGQAGLSITGAGDVISIAGEFRAVNNLQFEGIVRFSTNPPNGANDGPRTSTAAWGSPTAQSQVPGRIRITIGGTWDRDDLDLTYELLRDGTAAPVDSVVMSAGWWNVPTVTLEDSDVPAGESFTYRVRVSDGDGNTVTSGTVTASAEAGEVDYADLVLDDGATLYYPLGDKVSQDWAGNNTPRVGGGVSAESPAGVTGSATGYSEFNGSSNGRVSSTTNQAAPEVYSAELWFRTTTSSGGKLIGYGNSQTGTSGSYDRHVYMRNDGRLNFGTYPGTTKTISSAESYNDGEWHHVVATQSAEGMVLYVDGDVVATDATVTTAQAYSGYWRIGGDNLNGWPNSPSSNWFDGDIDEVAVYPTALAAGRVATHYAEGTGLEAPTATFTTASDDLMVSFDAGESTADGGASIEEYTWDFGDGSPAVTESTSTTTHSYAEAGTYTVTLTVRDSRGLVGVAQSEVSVLAANVDPTASFTSDASGLTVTVDGTGSHDGDGSIESYEWEWGDGTAAGSGSLATHAYAAAGTYTVTLTVTDDRGGTDTSTEEIVVTHADPVAAIDVTAAALTVQVDASGSSASDGADLSFSWNWGDGSPDTTGEQASHTYAEGGTYDITVTATDSFGSSATETASVTVSPTLYAASDQFDRVVSNGWGSADTGGVWTTMSGSSSVASVSGGEALLALAPGATRHMALQDLDLTDTESVLEYRMDFAPSDGNGYVGFTTRHVGSDSYIVQTWHRNNGNVWLVIQRGGTLLSAAPVNGLTWSEGDEFTLKAEVAGTSPTTLRAKIWSSTSAEPSGWQASTTDGTAAMQRSGYVTVRNVLSSSSASAGTVAFDSITVRDLAEAEPPAENVAPVAGFSSTVDGLAVTVDASATTDSDGTIASYSWNWGDGTADTSGVHSTHTYADAGDYTVTLTATDDDGATHAATQVVTVTAPVGGNSAPVAAFTAAVDALAVSVDGTGSTDVDGSIAAYNWNWGDGSADDAGATATHAYASAGTYTVTLTVTDDDGATHAQSHDVVVETQVEPGDELLADTFERTATSSWGTADVGGAWTITGGSAAAASVVDGEGRLSLAAGSTRFALLNETALREYRASVEFEASADASTGSTYAGFIARSVGSTAYYVHSWLRTDGSVWLVAQRGGTVLAATPVSGLQYTPGERLAMEIEVSGTATTDLKAKIWKVGSPIPETWHLQASDADAALQADGSMGLRANRASSSTAPTVVAFDSFEVRPLG